MLPMLEMSLSRWSAGGVCWRMAEDRALWQYRSLCPPVDDGGLLMMMTQNITYLRQSKLYTNIFVSYFSDSKEDYPFW